MILLLSRNMSLTATNLSALSRLFSSSVYRQLAEKGRSPLFARLFRDAGLNNRSSTIETVGDAFDAAFATLRKSGHRDEYVYRAALTHNLLLGRHSLNTASLLTEFRTGASKADLVILNGTSAAYEIKSERDSLARLDGQLINYRKVCAKVFVIAAHPFVQQIIDNTDEDIGVMALSRWNRITTVREANERPDLVCPITILDSIRTSEALQILENLNISVPTVPNTQIRGVLRGLFSEQNPTLVHNEMVETLKKSRNATPLQLLLDQIPSSLQPVALSVQVKQVDHERLVETISTPINQAINWG
jgi:hypothetical protein